nr:MAG: ORF1 [TTV-like mini virus]
MPWYRRRYTTRWRRPRYRRTRFWRRFRKNFPRFRNRRQRRVRRKRFYKKKLKKIILRQYQPRKIIKSKIKGLECLFQCNVQKIYFNFQMYEHSIVPKHLPGGGGWSVKLYSLQYLYDQYEHCRNIWTKSNHNLPLCRYSGCIIRLYQSYSQDYVFYYQNQFPMVTTMESYNHSQPSILMMHNKSIKVPAKLTKSKRKPYKTIKVKPPGLMQNKWYFTSEICNKPLLLTYTAAASFDNYYTSTQWKSTNCTIYNLKTGIFQNTKFRNNGNNPYTCTTLGTLPVYLYATDIENPTQGNVKAKDLILLGNTENFTTGFAYKDNHHHPYSSIQEYGKDKKAWGNPFHPDYFNNKGTYTIYQSTQSWASIISPNNPEYIIQINQFTKIDEMWEELRYPPNNDKGTENYCYFKPVNKDENHWGTPTSKPELINNGYPMWMLLWGYSDFVKRTESLIGLETNYCLTLKTNTTSPTRNLIVPLNKSFIEGHSPFEKQYNPLDYDRWHPSLQMQYEAINNICATGPGTPKLEGRETTEAKMEYIFYFKFGGSPPNMSDIEDPAEQPAFPIPNHFRGSATIENPATAPQNFLYNFDTKGDFITKKAIKRIGENCETKKILFADAEWKTQKITPPPQKKLKEEQELLLIQQLQQQHLLKRRILRELKQQQLK